MKITQVNRRSRNDFWADMDCEHCRHRETDVTCYEDANFHMNVIPNINCKECGKDRAGFYLIQKRLAHLDSKIGTNRAESGGYAHKGQHRVVFRIVEERSIEVDFNGGSVEQLENEARNLCELSRDEAFVVEAYQLIREDE